LVETIIILIIIIIVIIVKKIFIYLCLIIHSCMWLCMRVWGGGVCVFLFFRKGCLGVIKLMKSDRKVKVILSA